MYEDKTLVCVTCGKEFTFSAGEQAFYAEKGLTHEPKHCKACKDARKGKYDAVCAECGKPCKVNFEPSGDRPVYCNECYAKRKRQ